MKTSQIVASSFGTGRTEDPHWMAFVATSKAESVHIVLETMKAPLAAAGILQTSQEAAREMAPEIMMEELAWHLESSMQIMPDALGVRLAEDGNVLCINVGNGVLWFRLTKAAKDELKKL